MSHCRGGRCHLRAATSPPLPCPTPYSFRISQSLVFHKNCQSKSKDRKRGDILLEAVSSTLMEHLTLLTKQTVVNKWNVSKQRPWCCRRSWETPHTSTTLLQLCRAGEKDRFYCLIPFHISSALRTTKLLTELKWILATLSSTILSLNPERLT